MMKPVILDASVFIGLFLPDKNSKNTTMFFERSQSIKNLRFHIPSLFVYEVYAILLKYGDYTQDVYDRVSGFIDTSLEVFDLNDALIKQAIVITQTGHPKSGYPSFYDATYHALAIQTGGIFLTSDHRHVSKTKDFGHVCLLENWRDIFE